MPVPPDFQPHFRKSPVTDPWEPLFSRLREDGADLLFEVRPAHCNSRGFLHGGVLATLCDNAMGLSLGIALKQEAPQIVTVTLSIDYAGSARLGDTVVIVPRVIRAGGSLGFCDALVSAGDVVIARANATFRVHQPARDETRKA
jgi:uncharacterized protein (TIGR00369 family)